MEAGGRHYPPYPPTFGCVPLKVWGLRSRHRKLGSREFVLVVTR